jgi:short subunit dehydrogenase-like uncharacterized protein
MSTFPDPSDRPYDVVLLGATGFTGRLVAEHLAARTEGTGLRLAVAGRRRDALEALAQRLPGDVGVEVADTSELVTLLDLAGSTRVLATTVGPYARHGELVVQACVRQGTHYADITGEPGFVELVRERYGHDATRQGVKLVSCCGFDSVPHDFGARFTVGHLPDDAPLTVRGYVSGQARLSGGTLQSALGAIAARRMPSLRPTLIDGEPVRREVAALPPRLHRVPQLNAWGVPLPTIDPAVVLRSARELEGYGQRFRYGHYARLSNLPTVVAGVAGVGTIAAMASVRPTRAVLERLLPGPGDGPDEATRARSRFEVVFLGEGGGTNVTTRVAGGDPGYGETARWLGEAALSLAEDDGPDVAGALTPAVGLGAPYHERLVALGIRFEVLGSDG